VYAIEKSFKCTCHPTQAANFTQRASDYTIFTRDYMHVGHTITLVCAHSCIQHTLTETRPTTHTALTSSYSWPQTGTRGLTDRKRSCHTDAPCVPPPCWGHRRVHRIPCCARSHDPTYPCQLHRDLCLCEDGSCSRRARAVREVVGVSASLCEKTSRVNTSSTAGLMHTHNRHNTVGDARSICASHQSMCVHDTSRGGEHAL
jgi:hypothetical protein